MKMERFTKHSLPKGFNIKYKKFFYAEFYEDGQLKTYAFYPKRSTEPSFELVLEKDINRGTMLVNRFKSEGPFERPVMEKYFDGNVKEIEPITKQLVHEYASSWSVWVSGWIYKMWINNCRDTGFDPENPLSINDLKALSKRVARLKKSMDMQEVWNTLRLSEFWMKIDERTFGKSLDNYGHLIHLRKDAQLEIVENIKKGVLMQVHLLGKGWLNIKQKSGSRGNGSRRKK